MEFENKAHRKVKMQQQQRKYRYIDAKTCIQFVAIISNALDAIYVLCVMCAQHSPEICEN